MEVSTQGKISRSFLLKARIKKELIVPSNPQQNDRIGPLFVLLERRCMTRIFPSSYGRRLAILMYIFRTIVLTRC
jgi:hypothetical protein